ncbi:MAG: hypothetical protein ACKO2P_15025 [Planctomycetota bacterium]
MRSNTGPHPPISITLIGSLFSVLLCCSPLAAQDASPIPPFSAADVFPGTTAVYVELRDPPALLQTLLEHPLAVRLQQTEAWKQALRSPGMTGVMTARNFLELQFGKPWRETLAAVSANGIYLAVDGSDVLLLVHGRDADLMQDVRLKLLELTRLGGGEIRRLDTYRDIPVYRLPQGGAAVVGEWLVVVSSSAAGQKLLDRILDLPADNAPAADIASPAKSTAPAGVDAPAATPPQSLAAVPAFRTVFARDVPASAIRAWFGLTTVRTALQSLNRSAKGLFTDRIDNPVAELLFGGLQSVLGKADWATAELVAAPTGLQLSLATPFDAAWIPEQREWYFGPEAAGRVPAIPEIPETLGTIGVYRDISQMWLRAGDLFSEQINDRMAEAESNLGTIFAGRDFGEEVLGAIQPGMRLLVARQDFSRIAPVPAIRLPAFALLLTLKDPETMRPELRRIFQSIIGFGNIVGAQQGQPQLELDMQKQGDAEIISAHYLAPRSKGNVAAPSAAAPIPIIYNFSPTAAFEGQRMILASSRSLAEALLQAPTTAADPANLTASVSLPILQQLLSDNRDSIVSGNMLSKGQTRDEADAELDLVLQLLSGFHSATARLTPHADSLQLEFSLRTAESSGASADAR